MHGHRSSTNRRQRTMRFLMQAHGILLVLLFDLQLSRNNCSAVSTEGGPSGVSSNLASSSVLYDFEKLHSFRKRLLELEREAPGILLGFFDAQQMSFSVQPGYTKNQRVCITSSCYALLTLALSSDQYDSILSWNDEDSEDGDIATSNVFAKIPVQRVLRTLLTSKWREDDLFQVPLIIYTILLVDSDRSLLQSVAANDEKTSAKIRKLIVSVLKGRPQRSLGTVQLHSDYITYQVCKVLALLQTDNGNEVTSKGLPPAILPHDASAKVFWGLLRCAEISSNEVCRQLAYRTADDINSFDVVRLVYSLLTYIRSTESLAGLAGRELVPGEGPSPDTRVAPLNKKLVAAALKAFFEEQRSDGLWDKGQPIYKSFKEGKGRDMGGAFVFSVNCVGSLLCALPAEDFRPHLGALERTLEWIENHQRLEIIGDYVDPESGQCYGKPLRGWTSPHLSMPDAGPRAWSTAQVLKCVSWMSKTVRALMHYDVLEEFHGYHFSKDGIQKAPWNKLLDSDLGESSNSTEGEYRTLKSVLDERVVIPFAQSIEKPSFGAAYSAILHGPPGTAKTTICEALAKRMGYDFCVIDTGVFLADGLTNVAARIKYVFRRLLALDKCVILFDEIEEFALDRESPDISMESRMLTTAMLTAINDLRRAKKSLFFVATNRLRVFDSAIVRPGRFDLQLFVGTPNLESRVIQFQQKLKAVGATMSKTSYHKVIDTYRDFLASVWTKDAMFMNFLESDQFAFACANLVASRKKHVLSTSEMAAILKQQAAVMTVRGSARDEYMASMNLSRL